MTDTNLSYQKPKRRQDIVFPIVNAILLIILMFVTLYPVLNTVAISFNDGTDALRGGIGLWPRVWSFKSYESLLSDPATYQAAWISVSRTVITTILNLILTSMLAFTLSRKEYVLRHFLTMNNARACSSSRCVPFLYLLNIVANWRLVAFFTMLTSISPSLISACGIPFTPPPQYCPFAIATRSSLSS